jgi:hypothetical protein
VWLRLVRSANFPGRLRCRLAGRPCGQHRVAGSFRGRLGQAAAVGGDALLDGLGEVLPQMEPVGDLDRLRCAPVSQSISSVP